VRSTHLWVDGLCPKIEMAEAVWQEFADSKGMTVDKVQIVELVGVKGVLHMVRVAPGGEMKMHASPQRSICVAVAGKGKLGLPDGDEREFCAPEVFIFEPNAIHDWHGIEEETTFVCCTVDE